MSSEKKTQMEGGMKYFRNLGFCSFYLKFYGKTWIIWAEVWHDFHIFKRLHLKYIVEDQKGKQRDKFLDYFNIPDIES